MKSTKFILLSFLLLTVFSSFVNSPTLPTVNKTKKTAATQELFSYLRTHRQAKNIVVNWGTTSVTGIDHFVVYHSDDGDFFSPIANVPVDNAMKFTYKHESVFPGYHYYYIQAVMSAGPPVNSVVDVVRIVSHG